MPAKDTKNHAKVTVKLLGILKKAHGKGQTQLEIRSKDSLETAVEKMCEASPSLKRVLLDPELGTPLPNSVILVNSVEIGLLNGLKTELKDGDEVVFIPVIHGG
jgi:molybdopterin synthase sulfur carrier subunit